MPIGPLDCYVSIFVPDSPHAAGRANYELTQRIHGVLNVLDTQVIEQGTHHGDWVGIGPYRVTGDQVVLAMRSAGPMRDEVTAGAVHLYCGRPGEV